MRMKLMDDKLKAAMQQIERLYGAGCVYRYGDGIESGNVAGSISTGSIALNIATGVDGIPLGRIVEIFGPESGGKTTLSLHIIAEAQKMGLNCLFVDAEHALDVEYASNIGVDVEQLIINQPDCGEQGLDVVEKLVESGHIGLAVIDSVAALVPKAEIEGEFGDSHMGLHARLMSQAMRKLNGLAQKKKCCLIFINQIREKFNVMFGNPEITTGGRALKFYASMRIDIRRIGSVKSGNDVVANRTKAKIAKNKVASPFKIAEFDIRFGEGIDYISELIDFGIEYGILEKSGNLIIWNDQKIGNGREKARNELVNNKDLYIRIKKQVLGE
jgi:recombination protein RecA